MLLTGCAQRQFVTKRYPAWGEEILIDQKERAAPLHMRWLMPADHVRIQGCLLIVHGMNEYVGRYGDIAQYFAERFAVAGVDLRAHGLSNPVLRKANQAIAAGAERYDVSQAYLAQAELRDLEPLRHDFERALRYVINRCDALPGLVSPKPVFVLSHSLGSLVAASYLLDERYGKNLRDRVQGIVFSGPAFSVTEIPGWRGWFQNPFIRFSFYIHEYFLAPQDEPLPWLILNQALAFVTVPVFDGVVEMLSWPGLRQIFTPSNPDWVVHYLTDWEEEKARHRADGYIIRRSILRYVLGVEKEIIRFRRRMGDFSVPYLLIYSAQDPITPAWGNLDFAAQTRQKHPDNQLLPLPNKSHHEHLFSAPPLREQLLQHIDEWLDARL